MRFKLILALAALALSAPAGAQAQQQQDDRQVIDDFVQTRGFEYVEPGAKKPAGKTAPKQRPARQKPRRAPKQGEAAPGADAARKEPPAAPAQGGAAATGAATTTDAKFINADSRRLALGYTLYRWDGRKYVPSDTKGVFTKADMLRLMLETNADAYVYVFNTTDEATPVMLYPYAFVDGGANRVRAHHRDFVPPVENPYEFVDPPGTERIYLVVSRQPLAGVPVGEELVRRCGGALNGCFWQPSPAEWTRIKAQFAEQGTPREERYPALAQLPPLEDGMKTRGIRIKSEEPPPAVVRVSSSPAATLVVATFDLIHK